MNRRHLLIAGSTFLAKPGPTALAAQDATPPDPATALGFEALATAYLPVLRMRGALDAVAYVIRLQPGGRVDFPAGSRPYGASLDYVVAGSLAVRNDDSMMVLRDLAAGAGGSVEVVPPEQEVTVTQGEAMFTRGRDEPGAVHNPGDRETLVFGAGVFSRTRGDATATPTWRVVAMDASVDVVGAQGLEDGEGKVGVLLARWVLGPGKALPPHAGPWPELAWAESPFDQAGRSNPGAEPIEVLLASFHSAD